MLFWAANLGFTVSTVAAGVLVRQGYGILFWINAAAALLAALIVWRHVPETRPPRSHATGRALLPVLLRDPVMLVVATIHVIHFTMFMQAFTTLPLVMAGDGDGPGTYATMLALNGIMIVTVQPIAVRLLDGRDTASVLAVSMLLVGVGGGLGAVLHGAAQAAAIVVWTLGQIGVSVMFGATFADIAPADLRSRYMGVASTTWSVGAVLGPLVGTAVLDHAGRTVLWAACTATGIALFAAQRAVGPALRRRTLARNDSEV